MVQRCAAVIGSPTRCPSLDMSRVVATPRPVAATQARRKCPALAVAALAVMLVLSSNTGARADRDVLWDIVHGQCVPDEQMYSDPEPCAMVALQDGVEQGYAVLKDKRGKTQFLLIPTARITGIEDPELLEPGAPNYFAAAWQARTYVENRAGRPLPRDGIGLAVNSKPERTQDQLHIHIDCLRTDVRDVLREHASRIGDRWAPFDAPLVGQRYMAMRILGEELGQADPFRLLADGVPGAKEDMAQHTLVVTGATFADGGPGFIILDGRADPAAPGSGNGEDLQDHACALADGGSDEGVPR